MRHGDFSRDHRAAAAGADQTRKPVPQAMLCGLSLMVSTAIGLGFLYMHPKQGISGAQLGSTQAPATMRPARHVAAAHLRQPAAIAPLRRYASMLDPNLTTAYAPLTFAHSTALKSAFAPLARPVEATAPVVTTRAASNIVRDIPLPAAEQVAETEPTTREPTATPEQVASLTPTITQDEPQIVPPVPAVSEVVRDIPMPMPRPAALQAAHDDLPRPTAPRRAAQQQVASAPAPAAADTAPTGRPGFFERMFGGTKSPNSVLAYASPEDGAVGIGSALSRTLGGGGQSQSIDRYTAVYNISTHTVTLPDGTRLEAHSGLGAYIDDPRSVGMRMRGVTPPNLYDLKEREAPFHGVRALRLTSVDGSVPYGRAGLLAHTYMLGPRGDSNGCVVFRDYRAFLAAYDSGAVRRLAVVARGT